MDVQSEIEQIKNRNRRVEDDKAWERSWVRIGAIGLLTYAIAAGTLWKIGTINFWYGALIPTLGFVLSTLTLPPLKQWWMRRQADKKRP